MDSLHTPDQNQQRNDSPTTSTIQTAPSLLRTPPAAASSYLTGSDWLQIETSQSRPQKPVRIVPTFHERTQRHYNQVLNALLSKGSIFWNSEEQEASHFQDLDFGDQHALLNYWTRGQVSVQDAIAGMPRGRWSDYASTSDTKMAGAVDESDFGAFEQLQRVDSASESGSIGGLYDISTLPEPMLTGGLTDTSDGNTALREVDVRETEAWEQEEMSFRAMHRVPGYNVAPYGTEPHAKMAPDGSGVVRWKHPAVIAMQHPSKNRRSFAQAHMDDLAEKGVKVFHDRLDGRASVGGLESKIVDFKSGTVPLYADPEFIAFYKLGKQIRGAA